MGRTTTPAASASSPRSVGLQTLLMALPAIVVLPLLVFAAWLLHLVDDGGRQEADRALRDDARTLAFAVERELAGLTEALAVFAAAPALQGREPDYGRFGAYARRAVVPGLGLSSLALLDADGRRLVDTALADGALPPVRLRPHHLETLRTGEAVVSPLHESALDGRLSVSINVPLPPGDGPRRLLTARVPPERFMRLLPARALQTDRVATLVDGDRRIVARSRDPQAWIGRHVLPDATAAMDSGPHGTTRFVNFEGEDFLWAWQRLDNGWAVIVGLPAAQHEGALRASLWRLVVAGAGALAIGLLAAWLLGRRISRAVARTGRDAERLLDGGVPEDRPSGVRQLDALHHAMQAAAIRLDAARRERAQALEAERGARAEAEHANRAKDEFLAMLSHELRNPLSPIVNLTRLLARTEPLSERGRQAVEVVDRQARQLKRLVDDLLEVTRVSKGRITLRPQPLEVRALLEEAVQTASALTSERGQPLTLAVAPGTGRIEADPVRLKQVMENLLGNAIKYTRPVDAIHVEAEGDDDGVTIRVRDRGVGIAPENLSRIFGLFVQADATLDRSQGGLGIGLAWVRSIVRMHGGSVTADSAGKGQGATFTVRLPRRFPAGDEETAAALPTALDHPDAPRRRVADLGASDRPSP